MAIKEPTPFTRSDSIEVVRQKQALMVKALEDKPMTTAELAANVIKNSENLTLRYLKDIEETGVIERIPNSYYWRRGEGWKYKYNLAEDPINRIPHIFFRDIPIIQPWYRWALDKENAMRLIGVFENICRGEVVSTFKINPSKWQHPQTTQLFYDEYKDQYKKELRESVVKAVRAFLTICLNINLQRGNIRENKMMGLQVSSPKGQYAYIKMSDADIQKTIDWLASADAVNIIEEAGLKADRMQAHFAFAFEGFPRPSRCLTIETNRIEKYPDKDGKPVLHWNQIETKQDKYYPKFIKNPQLVAWADRWLEKRQTLDYRYLFVDDNSYQVQKNDSSLLQKEREPYSAVYKKIFSQVLGKKESYFYTDTLYAIRHCGVHLWLQRTGYNYDMVGWMGWENTDTLKKFYGALGNKDLLRFVLNGSL